MGQRNGCDYPVEIRVIMKGLTSYTGGMSIVV